MLSHTVLSYIRQVTRLDEEKQMPGAKNVHQMSVDPGGSDDEKRLLPMLIAGLALIVVGMVAVMWFV